MTETLTARQQSTARNDALIVEMFQSGQWTADTAAGIVYGTHGRPIGKQRPGGYVMITFRHLGKVRNVAAHRTMWVAEHGTIDSTLEINHRNRVRNDNRIVNLEQVTHLENMGHRSGTYRYVGERPEDLKYIFESDPEWFARVQALADSGDATPEAIAALRAEVTFDTGHGLRYGQMNHGVRVMARR